MVYLHGEVKTQYRPGQVSFLENKFSIVCWPSLTQAVLLLLIEMGGEERILQKGQKINLRKQKVHSQNIPGQNAFLWPVIIQRINGEGASTLGKNIAHCWITNSSFELARKWNASAVCCSTNLISNWLRAPTCAIEVKWLQQSLSALLGFWSLGRQLHYSIYGATHSFGLTCPCLCRQREVVQNPPDREACKMGTK